MFFWGVSRFLQLVNGEEKRSPEHEHMHTFLVYFSLKACLFDVQYNDGIERKGIWGGIHFKMYTCYDMMFLHLTSHAF